MFKRYGLPMLIMIVLGIGINILQSFLHGEIGNIIIKITICALLFSFGLVLNNRKRSRNESWFKKIVISFFLIFFLVWDLGYIMIPQLKSFFNLLGINGLIIYLVYICCGWSFFD